MTTLTVSQTGTANLAKLSASDLAKNARKPEVAGDGSINTQGVESTETSSPRPSVQLLRAFSPDVLLEDPDGQSTGRFVDVSA
ncbi:hypothetical protein [Luteibacter aegosomatissinici]|uniref:hypothetical protein n=1 Tax=Luteibacter aegosomatissinici TaxID=2911539 RepID=UPI001FFB960F|nr:hypothetical protein [Luteibacter aegosomatissinici]UPG92754.1 hypothetical protein L2Y97_12855 [Luteibacter aegosomatissinici]